MSTIAIFVLVLWYAQSVAASSDKTEMATKLEPIDPEARLKRITETIHRIQGPGLDGGVQSERLVEPDNPPSDSQFMMRNDEMFSSGDGAIDDEEGGDDGDGELGSGDAYRSEIFDPDDRTVSNPFTGGRKGQPSSTEGVYPADLDENKKKQGSRTFSSPGSTRKSHIESDQRHPPPKSKPSSSSSLSSSLRLFAVLLLTSLLHRTLWD